ncbi:MAG: hypothetical protein N2652_04690 [Kiritimatiellae bacterium]|nr:hypothetical protein [Kiritimatiellia bacterium]
MKALKVGPWIALVAGVVTATAALRICPACGHEAGAEDTQCGHCKAALPPPARAPAQPVTGVPAAVAETSAPPSAAGAPQLRNEVVAEQIATARRLAEQGAAWGAILFARNAAAMLAIQGPQTAEQRVALAALIRDARRRLVRAEQPCPVCRGTGAQRMKALTLKGEVVDQVVVGGKCGYCRGLGRVPARTPDDQLANEEAQALQSYAAEQQKRGLEEVRDLWLPAGLWETLSPKQQAAARRAAGVVCERCHGFGSQSCATCNGAGISGCGNQNCAGGTEICPDCNGRGRSSGTRGATALQTRCETCNGTGKRTCTECTGKGFVECSKCAGRGESVCAACRGTGEGSPCSKCQGDGTIPCSRCSGSGRYREAICASCDGRGASLCKSCNGAGRVSRR